MNRYNIKQENKFYFLSNEDVYEAYLLENNIINYYLSIFKIKNTNNIQNKENISIAPEKAYKTKIFSYYGELYNKFYELFENNSKGIYWDLNIKEDKGSVILISQKNNVHILYYFFFEK